VSNKFVASLTAFEQGAASLDKEAELFQLRDALISDLKLIKINSGSLKKDHSLLGQSRQLKASIEKSVVAWSERWEINSPMRELSEKYSDRVILLVFGKVNAGKSSFSNFLSSLFSDVNIKRFYLEDNEVSYTEEEFKVGIVETTARIQGVELGSNLVLLDTPGLHSVTDENGDKTRRFTDSADAILWLTPSTAPGQVQELNDLKAELERKKVLLPIITRSDFVDEDVDEHDEIIKILQNKSSDNRSLQEEDVFKRTVEKIGKDIGKDNVKKPLSISIHAYQKSSKKIKNEKESGLTELYIALSNIIDKAKFYKLTKARQQIVNYLDSDVLGLLNKDVLPQIDVLKKSAEMGVAHLEYQKYFISSNVVLDVIKEVSGVVGRYKDSGNKVAIAEALNKIIVKHLNFYLEKELSEYLTKIKMVDCSLSSSDLGDFKAVTVDVEQIKGSSARALGAASGAAAGAAAGSLAGPIGTLVGGVLGGLFGSKAGEFFIETETVTETIGVNTEAMERKIVENIEKRLAKVVCSTVDEIIDGIKSVKSLALKSEFIITEFEQKVIRLKG